MHIRTIYVLEPFSFILLGQSYKWRFRLIRVSEANTYRRSLITLRMSSSDEGFDKKTNSVMINKRGEHMERVYSMRRSKET